LRDILTSFGAALLATGDARAAERELARAVALAPDDREAKRLLHQALLRGGRAGDAIDRIVADAEREVERRLVPDPSAPRRGDALDAILEEEP